MSKEATFGFWLKDCRKVLDLTQDELALRVGCSPMLVRKIEADERRPSKQIAELLAAQFDIPIDERADFVRFARSKNARFAPTEKSPWRTWRHHLTNLPIPPTPLFGREQALETVVRQITHDPTRLLTLVGPPGIGKTRLALACAERLLDQFEDGVYFVSLAPLRDAGLIADTIARALGVKEIAGQSPFKSLTDYLADKRLLILLDNFEQVVAAAPLVAELLTLCPWLYVLVTSRVSLHVRAERQFRVAPLALPSPASRDDPKQMLASPALQLFVDRALAIEPGFSVSSQNVSVLAQICARLDGLPLAIELIATRVSTLSPQELLAQIERRLAVVTEGASDLSPRHQTWHDAIAWSYELLDAEERQLFVRLAIFVGGCTTPAVAQVCGGARALARLADKSLLTNTNGRFSMLETVREYALELFAESGAANEIRWRYVNYFLQLAESAEPELTGAQQILWLDRLEHEHHNLRAALHWTLETGNPDITLRMSGALWRFWQTRGYFSEGLECLQAALNLTSTNSDSIILAARAKALSGAGWLWRDCGDFVRMRTCFEECLTICKQLDNRSQLAYALYSVGYADFIIGDHTRGIQTIEESVALYRTMPDEHGIALPLFMLGRIAVGKGDFVCAHARFIESLEIERKRGATFGNARTLGNLGELAIYRGEYVAAEAYLNESQTILNELGERQLTAWVMTKRGELAWRRGDLVEARNFLETSLKQSREIGYRWNTAYSLTYLGLVMLSEGDAERAESLCADSLALFRELESEQDVAQTQKDLAQVLLQRGDCARAEKLYKECLCVLAKRNCLPDVAECLEGLATLRGSHGDRLTSVRLFGAAEALREKIGAPLAPVLLTSYQRAVTVLRAQLDEQTFGETWTEGRALSLEQTINLVEKNIAC